MAKKCAKSVRTSRPYRICDTQDCWGAASRKGVDGERLCVSCFCDQRDLSAAIHEPEPVMAAQDIAQDIAQAVAE
jgi:hypothetical protein